MIKIITLILLLILCLITYTLLIKEMPKKEESQTIQKNIDSFKNREPFKESPTQTNSQLQQDISPNNKPLPKVKKPITQKENHSDIPNVELKYYNLSLEKDYNEYYNNDEQTILEQPFPPLTKEKIEEKDDLNINLTPEINYNKETKEISIDGVQIQLEKKF